MILVCIYCKVIADTERAILDALDKQYADVLSPIKDNLNPKIFGLKYVQKLAKGTTNIYFVPDEVCVLFFFTCIFLNEKWVSTWKVNLQLFYS